MTTRDRILDAAAELLWDRGYASTSPRSIQERAGVGQSSMYHHFAGKSELAAASLQRDGDRLRRSTAELLGRAESPVQAVLDYLTSPREELRGCKLGRMTQDPEVLANDDLRSPIAETLGFYQGRIAALLEAARRDGELIQDFSPVDVAATVVAIVQGAHVIARAEQSPEAFERVIQGGVQMVTALRVK